MTKPAEHFPALDGLRGLAALLVVISHSANAGMLPAVFGAGLGTIGVGLFFVLSGFLMSRLYIRTDPTQAQVAAFAVARLARVMPLFSIVVLASWAFTTIHRGIFFPIDDFWQVLRHLTFAKGDHILWTVPVEMQFYALFAVAWVARWHGYSVWFLVAGLVSSACFTVWLWHQGGVGTTYSLVAWLHVFAFGAVFGTMWQQNAKPRVSEQRRHALAWAVATMALLLPPELRRTLEIPLVYVVFDPFSLAMIAAIFFCTLNCTGPFGVLRSPLLRFLGTISFGLYLLHLPVLHLIQTADLPIWSQAPTLFVASTCAAGLSLRWIERPAQRLIRKKADAWMNGSVRNGIGPNSDHAVQSERS